VRLVLAAALACVAALAACSSGGADPAPSADSRATTTESTRTATTESARPPRFPPLARAHCPADLTNCRTARGEIIYVERVDPDGDGDAHFVLLSRQSITLPGISVIDVEKSMRPHPLPGPGDRISAAGPVYRGSYGQRQIQALELHVARRSRPARGAS
jgi:hypothetical protein